MAPAAADLDLAKSDPTTPQSLIDLGRDVADRVCDVRGDLRGLEDGRRIRGGVATNDLLGRRRRHGGATNHASAYKNYVKPGRRERTARTATVKERASLPSRQLVGRSLVHAFPAISFVHAWGLAG